MITRGLIRGGLAGGVVLALHAGVEVLDARVDELCRMLGTTRNDPGAREHVVQLLRGVGLG